MRPVAMVLRRLVLWVLRGLAKPLLPLTAFLVLTYVLVGPEEGKEGPGASSPDEWSENDQTGQVASRLESDPLAPGEL